MPRSTLRCVLLAAAALLATWPAVAAPAAAAAPKPFADERLVPGDDPLYHALAELAGAGLVPGAEARQFAGKIEAVYSRRQIVEFAAAVGRALLDPAQAGALRGLHGPTLVAAHFLFTELQLDLAARGLPLAKLLAALEQHGFKPATVGSVLAIGRAQNGRQALDGRLDGGLQSAWSNDFHSGLTLSTQYLRQLPIGDDRQLVAGYYAEWQPVAAFTVGLGRRSIKYGPGSHDMMIEDRMKPLDQLYFTWRTKFLGEPFSLEQQTGVFGGVLARFVTYRRYEFEPTRHLSLAFSEALQTLDGTQTLTTLAAPLPLYLNRFVAGQRSQGGAGNYAFELDAAQRFGHCLTLYGEFFADDMDWSGNHTTAQLPGWLAGLRYTPSHALTGTAYRLEAAVIPGSRTYVENADPRLVWVRDGVIMGHEYGPEGAGVLLEARQRFTPRFDLTLTAEHFETFRKTELPAETNRAELRGGYDLGHRWAVQLGYRYNHQTNQAEELGNNRLDSQVFVQTQAAF
jgi:hypothetical protein